MISIRDVVFNEELLFNRDLKLLKDDLKEITEKELLTLLKKVMLLEPESRDSMFGDEVDFAVLD